MRILAALLFTAIPAFALAQDAASTRDDFAHACKLTPPNRTGSYPGAENITKYNNLVQPAGKSVPAPGQFVYLTGRVFDERCVPLSDARVELWQANTDGRNVYPDKGSFANPYPLFAGTGETYTDGEGRFTFYTLFPGAEKDRAPYLNLRVTHENTRDLFATMFFEGETRNAEDPSFKKLPDELKPLALGKVESMPWSDGSTGLHVHYDVTVAGKDPFRRF